MQIVGVFEKSHSLPDQCFQTACYSPRGQAYISVRETPRQKQHGAHTREL